MGIILHHIKFFVPFGTPQMCVLLKSVRGKPKSLCTKSLGSTYVLIYSVCGHITCIFMNFKPTVVLLVQLVPLLHA